MKTKTLPHLHKTLFDNYESYKTNELRSDRIVFNDIKKIIGKLRRNNKCTIERLGRSIEGRDINLVKLGTGKTKILAWTQMHGDESTPPP